MLWTLFLNFSAQNNAPVLDTRLYNRVNYMKEFLSQCADMKIWLCCVLVVYFTLQLVKCLTTVHRNILKPIIRNCWIYSNDVILFQKYEVNSVLSTNYKDGVCLHLVCMKYHLRFSGIPKLMPTVNFKANDSKVFPGIISRLIAQNVF